MIILNVNELNAVTKGHRRAERINKQDPIHAVYKRLTSHLGTHADFGSKGLEEGVPANRSKGSCSSTTHAR